MNAVAITDHGNLYGAIEFYKKARKAGIKPILGVEAYLAPFSRLDKRPKIDEVRYHQILLAKNNAGWRNLLQIVTKSHLEGFYYKPRIDRALLEEYHEGLICLSSCLGGLLGQLITTHKLQEARETVLWYKKLFGDDYYLEVQVHAPEIQEAIFEFSKEYNIPVVATQDSHYILKEDKTAHEVLLAVQTNNKLDSGNRFSLRKYDLSVTSPQEMSEIFKDHPEVLHNTVLVANKCDVNIELGKSRLPRYPLPDGEMSEEEYLKKLVYERLLERFPKPSQDVLDRLQMELEVIKKTGFSGYFLIVQDFVNWAKDHGIVVGPGRGSAAGSLVSYVLRITNIDPLKYDLLFERFLNPDRIQVPDIDIDFTDVRRDEVLAYVRERYGDDRVAQIITFGTMMARAAIRDSGRALGLSYGFCDRIAKLIPFNSSILEAINAVPELKTEYENDADTKRLIDAAKKLEGVARHASVHACGVVISPESLPSFVPIQRAPQGDDSIITQFEMHSVEDIGLLKMDFLGLKNLTIIEQTLQLIKENHSVHVDINTLPLDDLKTYQLLQKGETTGVFQLESSGMKRYLKELKPNELEDIIVMVSLYRPGPMDLIPQYINRKYGKEKVTYLHPKLEPILRNTYGVGVYQEQMMRIARDLAGFTLAEADTLRKAIGKKIKELLDEQQDKLIKGMVSNGIDLKTAKAIWELFPPFARYGFNRSHAACYAMISYQTAYLKAQYPVEFSTALLNISGTDVDRINFLVSETRKLGIQVLPPDINASFRDFTVDGSHIRFGLSAVKNVGATIVDVIIQERNYGGPFHNLAEFLSRIQHRDMNKKSLESLIKCGALDSLGTERSIALGNIEELLKFNQAARQLKTSSQSNLFGTSIPISSLRLKATPPVSNSELLSWEKELLGLYLSNHPFREYEEKVKHLIVPIRQAKSAPKRGVRSEPFRLAGIVTNVQPITTKNGTSMLFVTIEDVSDSIEVLVFSDAAKKHAQALQVGKPVLMGGCLSWKNGDTKFICEAAKEIPKQK